LAGASIGTPSQHKEPPKTRRDESQRDRVCSNLLSPWTRTRFQRGSQHLHALFDQPRGRKFALESFDGGAETSSRAGDVFLDLVRRLVRAAYSTTILGSRGTPTRPCRRHRICRLNHSAFLRWDRRPAGPSTRARELDRQHPPSGLVPTLTPAVTRLARSRVPEPTARRRGDLWPAPYKQRAGQRG